MTKIKSDQFQPKVN